VKTFAPRLQELIGYGVYRGLIGHIDKKSAAQILGSLDGFRSIWEQT
jgi:hypothetical protein